MPTLTTNYSFSLPVEGADDDVWGGFLNANWSALDAQLFSGTIGADTTGNAATATTATAATLAAEAIVLETARTLTIAGSGKTFDGSANIAWTRADLGIELASQAEAETGTDNAKLMTPLRVAQSVTENAPVPAQLSEAQATDPNSTVFGTVSGDRLAAQTDDAFNVSGAAPKYACRAWVNFDGTGTVSIRASGNVSSITDNGAGDYTVNFTTAMPDADYSAQMSFGGGVSGGGMINTYSTTGCRLQVRNFNNSSSNPDFCSVAVFR